MSISNSLKRRRQIGKLLVSIGVILLVTLVFVLKSQQSTPPIPSTTGQQAETQLANARATGQPALGFYHSNNCDSCLEMIAIVAEVYPAYTEQVLLVDVDVYEPSNQALLRQEQIRVIPTLIFYDSHGERKTVMGVISPQALQAQLATIAGE